MWSLPAAGTMAHCAKCDATLESHLVAYQTQQAVLAEGYCFPPHGLCVLYRVNLRKVFHWDIEGNWLNLADYYWLRRVYNRIVSQSRNLIAIRPSTRNVC